VYAGGWLGKGIEDLAVFGLTLAPATYLVLSAE